MTGVARVFGRQRRDPGWRAQWMVCKIGVLERMHFKQGRVVAAVVVKVVVVAIVVLVVVVEVLDKFTIDRYLLSSS